jgi:hypothetical protein
VRCGKHSFLQSKAAYLYKGYEKIFARKIHRALRIMSDRATFGLDGKRNYQLF